VDDRIACLLARADVAAARSWLEAHDEHTLELQLALTSIPAPTGDEVQRAAFVLDRFQDLELADVASDAAGNVRARYGDGAGPGIIIAAHLDTVFAERVIRPQKEGGRLVAPGIGDNGRGLAAMIALAQACAECEVRASRPITFVATVGEEGEGDLRGVKHLFADQGFRPAGFIALDGPGLDRVVHRATGSRRLRASFSGPGGHSWAAFGVVNPAHAVGAAACAIGELKLSVSPRATASVVRIGGGHSLNTIPQEAWLDLDLRAEEEPVLEALERDAVAACQRAVDRANRRRAPGTAALELALSTLGARPSGATSDAHPLVQAAVAATRALGVEPQLASASTDANVPISLGVPAVALGAGGKGGDTHLASEWYENVGGSIGVVRALLVALAATEH